MSHEARNFHQEYVNWGNVRPPQDILVGMIYDDLSYTTGPFAMLRTAHACIDMAMSDPVRSNQWTQHARDTFDRIIRWPNAPKAHISRAIVSAHLQKSFLDSWEAAAQAHAPTIDYPEFMTHIYKANLESYGLTNNEITEILPIVLGVRALHRDQPGWLGRLALYREDKRAPAIIDRTSWSWDTALVAADTTPEEFDMPEVRLQMMNGTSRKTTPGRQHGRKSYARAGIILLNATHCGIGDADKVISSCMYELDPSIETRGMPLLDSSELDDLTSLVRIKILGLQKYVTCETGYHYGERTFGSRALHQQ